MKIAMLLDEIGVYEIEAGTPVLGDEEQEGICNIIKNTHQAKISVWSRMNICDVKQSIICRPDIIHIGTPVSYVQIYSKLKKNKSWVMKNILKCVEVAKTHDVDVTVGLEDASRSDIGFMLSMIRELWKAGVRTVRMADTVGMLTPGRTKELVGMIKENTDMMVEMHVHNDLGMAVANSMIGAKAGAEYIDCTLFGIGERAGNCNFYDFIHFGEGVFQFAMTKKQVRWVEDMVNQALQIN